VTRIFPVEGGLIDLAFKFSWKESLKLICKLLAFIQFNLRTVDSVIVSKLNQVMLEFSLARN